MVCVVVLCASPAAAQDSNYWSEQYGTRSELLGGAVVGSPQDLSTTYYNPGGLANLQTESFLLSAQAFEYEWLTVTESSGNFDDLYTENFGVAPSLLAGTFPRHWLEGTLAYSFLSRQRSRLRIDNWTESADSSITNTLIDTKMSENWGGLTWARATGDLGLGVTLYGAYRSQRSRFEVLTQGSPSGGGVVATVDDFSYWHARVLAKAGVYWQMENASVGLAFTTPGLPLFGSGKAAYTRNIVAGDSLGGMRIITGAVPDDISVTYRSPMSISIGGRYGFGRNALYITMEWFNSMDSYQVLETNQLPLSGTGSSLSAALRQELEAVLNVGIGYEYSPREKLTFYGSFLTDFSGAVDDADVSHSVSTWNIYQVVGGVAFTVAEMDFTLGGSFAMGGDELSRAGDRPAEPFLDTVDVNYRRLKVFVGFEFGS